MIRFFLLFGAAAALFGAHPVLAEPAPAGSEAAVAGAQAKPADKPAKPEKATSIAEPDALAFFLMGATGLVLGRRLSRSKRQRPS